MLKESIVLILKNFNKEFIIRRINGLEFSRLWGALILCTFFLVLFILIIIYIIESVILIISPEMALSQSIFGNISFLFFVFCFTPLSIILAIKRLYDMNLEYRLLSLLLVTLAVVPFLSKKGLESFVMLGLFSFLYVFVLIFLPLRYFPSYENSNRFGLGPLDTSNQAGNVSQVTSTPVTNEVVSQPVSQEGNTQPVAVVTPPQV